MIREVLASRGIALKKRWGQNFMIAPSTREKIVGLLDPGPDDTVWEIGPGLGSLTAILLRHAKSVTAFEVDWAMVRVVEDRFGGRVEMVQGDAATTTSSLDHVPPALVTGNLPYRSAAAIIGGLLERTDVASRVRAMVFTVQREMARRIVARPGVSDYSSFSVLCSLAAVSSLAGDVPHTHFYPEPNVVSSIVVMKPRNIDPDELRVASFLARSLFASRRKTIANNLEPVVRATGFASADLLSMWGGVEVSATQRAETLAPAVFARMAGELVRRGFRLPTPGESGRSPHRAERDPLLPSDTAAGDTLP